MTAKRLELGARARADLAEIWYYSAETWGHAQAERYNNALHEALTELASGVQFGQRAPVRGFFRLKVRSHVIYYRERPSVIRVVRILHSKQDVETQLSRRR